MDKKNTIIAFFLLVCLTSLYAQTQPNILFLNVDDLKPMLGSYDYKDICSPNIDSLAENGVVFENAYCQQAVCAPSRISLLTGLRPDRTKVWDLRTFMRDMNPDVVTLPQIFKQNGYETVGYGKIFHGARNGDQISWTIPYEKDDKLTYADVIVELKGDLKALMAKYENDKSLADFRKITDKDFGSIVDKKDDETSVRDVLSK